jgi:hypothetical protein
MHVTEAPVKAYAHCVNSRCPGNHQVEVAAVAVETIYSFQDTGGDGTFAHPERSNTRLRFADPGEDRCEHCGKNRDLSENPRMQLDDSGYDRNALLDIEPDLRDPELFKKGGSGHVVIDDERTTALEAQNADLREQLAELRGIILGKQSGVSEVGPLTAEEIRAAAETPEAEPEE